MPDAQIRKGRAQRAVAGDEDALRVAPHLVEAVDLFAELRSQWRTASAGLGGFVFTGLDYAALEPTLRLLNRSPKDTAGLFRRLKVMEMEALRAMNERR